jgi:hypothetical protein
MAGVTAAETSFREGKRCPHMGTFNLRSTCKSKSGRLMSGLYGALGNTSNSYLLCKSVTTLPQVRVCIVHNEWPVPEQVGSVFVLFLRNFCIQSR